MQDGRVGVVEVADPEPGPGEVVVDVLACGVCGSDLHCARHGAAVNAATRHALGVELLDIARPVSLGHEFVGAISEYGANTQQTLPAGTRVVSMAALMRATRACVGFSGPEVPGGCSDRMLLSEPLLMPVPDHVDTAVAALTAPLVAASRTVDGAGLGPDDVVAVIGCGPVGLAVLAVLRSRGRRRIVAVDLSPARRELAGRMGADVVVDPARTLGPLPLRPPVAFACGGAPGSQRAVADGSDTPRTVLAGPCLDTDSLGAEEIDVRFAPMCSPDRFFDVFDELCAGRLDVAPMISDHVSLDEVPGALTRLATDPCDAKVLVDPSRAAPAGVAEPVDVARATV
ncbi:alcohol dehydrogenase [Actinomycetospora sp. NBRC 106378]|nr:alcohol dehydrogenase [Actinomycetospora sp. NBRC 106378]